MRIIVDVHLHSRFSRATSPKLNIDTIFQWAKYKGLNIINAPDFTHPFWLSEMKQKLEQQDNGLLKYKSSNSEKDPQFILATEISCIYSQGGKGRRVHILIFAPSFEIVDKINEKLSKIGNLYADGRPILGISAKELTKTVLGVSKDCFIIPAHVWTPWFAIFGSKSGFDTVEECFEEITPEIFALETGLSSDPAMNWRLSELDKYALISGSDSHSLPRMGREANVFEISDKKDFSFSGIKKMLKEASPQFRKNNPLPASRLDFTIEFFPEEGIYHYDGHRNCDVNISPDEARKLNNKCPKCGRELTIGVLHRVVDLADREDGFVPDHAVQYKSFVPLLEIVAQSLNENTLSKTVLNEYNRIVQTVVPELPLFLDYNLNELTGQIEPKILENIKKMREGKVEKIPGYDGVYGIIRIKEGVDEPKSQQQKLF